MQNKPSKLDIIEKILFRRCLEKRIEGYTIETSLEIFDALYAPQVDEDEIDSLDRWDSPYFAPCPVNPTEPACKLCGDGYGAPSHNPAVLDAHAFVVSSEDLNEGEVTITVHLDLEELDGNGRERP